MRPRRAVVGPAGVLGGCLSPPANTREAPGQRARDLDFDSRSPPPSVEVERHGEGSGVVKRYGQDAPVLAGVDLEVPAGVVGQVADARTVLQDRGARAVYVEPS